MTNEFGKPLDRNGYAPRLIYWPEERCFICGRADRPIQRHEVFHGPYREKSKRYGCWVGVCDYCHTKIHKGEDMLETKLKGIHQKKAMREYGWTEEQFREIFGKSYWE